MQSLDLQVLEQARDWLQEGRRTWLCTIVKTTGASPRPVGALLACTADGDIAGSLSGGCVEDDLVQRLGDGTLAVAGPELVEYGVSPEQNERLGLPCGGRLHVLVQSLARHDLEWLLGAIDALALRHCVLRCLDLDSGATTLQALTRFESLSITDQHLRQSFGPKMRMLLVGAGQLAQSLAELALAMDYEVLVTDPRQALLDAWPGPAVTLVPGMPDDAVAAHANDPLALVITLTHDPRIDDMALMEALPGKAWYVGALGSARTTEKRLQRLRQLELPEAAVARLHAPVGLPIGSKTPIEIAVAIMAQLTDLRRHGG